MAKLMRMILAVVGAALLNKMLKGSPQSSTNSHNENQANHLKALQNIILALLLSRSRKTWLLYPATISTISALLASFMNSFKKDHEAIDQIIETNEYKIVNETENREFKSEAHKVTIDNGR